jgi:hypothetical protein
MRWALCLATVVAVWVLNAAGAGAAQIRFESLGAIDPHHFLSGVACASASQCTAVDHGGYEVTFDPEQPVTHLVRHALPGCTSDSGGGPGPGPCPPSGPTRLNAVSCPSQSECVAADQQGADVEFDPQTAVSAKGADEIAWGGELGLIIYGLDCVSTTACVGLDGDGPLEFDPLRAYPRGVDLPTWDSPVAWAMTCASASQCTYVDTAGREGTFDPAPLRQLYGPPRQIDHGGWFNGVSCPSVVQCTAVDRHGRVVTFAPRSHRARVQQVDRAGLNAIACPSTRLCVAVDRRGAVATGTPGRAWHVEPVPGAGRLEAVTCPLPDQCIIVDADGDAFGVMIANHELS